MTSKDLFESKVPVLPPRILLGPGPSMVHPRVLQSMMSGMIGYLDADFLEVIDEVSRLLKLVFQTDKNITLALSGTGSAGMEAGLSSLLEPDDTVVICSNGFFSERMAEMSARLGANVVVIKSEWGKPFPPELLKQELQRHSKVKLVAIVHAETSTGVKQPIEDISRLAKEVGALLMLDAVTSLGGNEVKVDCWDVDYCYSATQKCLGCPPGLSPAALSLDAHEIISKRSQKPSSWYLDLNLISNYWGYEHVYHHTAPVSMILALREGLRIVLEEGMESRFKRHSLNASALRTGLQALGLKLVAPEGYQLDQVTPFWLPPEVDELKLRQILLNDHGIEVGKGLGQFAGKVIRVGLMGESSKSHYVLLFLSALEQVLERLGHPVPSGSGVGAASNRFSGV